MQATVASYDDDTRSGTVVTDQGETLGFVAATLAEHIRHLRPGQRVHIERDQAAVSSVRIWL